MRVLGYWDKERMCPLRLSTAPELLMVGVEEFDEAGGSAKGADINESGTGAASAPPGRAVQRDCQRSE